MTGCTSHCAAANSVMPEAAPPATAASADVAVDIPGRSPVLRDATDFSASPPVSPLVAAGVPPWGDDELVDSPVVGQVPAGARQASRGADAVRPPVAWGSGEVVPAGVDSEGDGVLSWHVTSCACVQYVCRVCALTEAHRGGGFAGVDDCNTVSSQG